MLRRLPYGGRVKLAICYGESGIHAAHSSCLGSLNTCSVPGGPLSERLACGDFGRYDLACFFGNFCQEARN